MKQLRLYQVSQVLLAIIVIFLLLGSLSCRQGVIETPTIEYRATEPPIVPVNLPISSSVTLVKWDEYGQQLAPPVTAIPFTGYGLYWGDYIFLQAGDSIQL